MLRRRTPVRNQLARLRGAIAKLTAGIPLGGERVWPGTRNDLFVAHVSVYRFFAGFAAGRRVLDAGCGLGYGSALLLEAGARDVLGIDIDPASIRYASRHFRRPGLRFSKEDLEELCLDAESFDLIVSSNVLEHLHKPQRFFEVARQALGSTGELVIAVPPIVNPRLLEDNQANPHHVSNLTPEGWLALASQAGFVARVYRHGHPRIEDLDFSSHLPSRFRAEEFTFEEVSLSELFSSPTLSATFHFRPAAPE